MIWFKEYKIEDFLWMAKGNMVEHLGIEITKLGNNYLEGKMPVDQRTKQPMGILHGGASAVLSETLGSIASNLIVDPEKFVCVGMEINANHLRPVQSGYVYGKAEIVHIGKTTHVWNTWITNEENKLVCISRLTMSVRNKPSV